MTDLYGYDADLYDDEPTSRPAAKPRRVRSLQRGTVRARTAGQEVLAAERRAEVQREAEAAEERRAARVREAEEAEREARNMEGVRIAEYLARQPKSADDVLAVAGAICSVAGISVTAVRELLAQAYEHGEMARMVARRDRSMAPRNPYKAEE